MKKVLIVSIVVLTLSLALTGCAQSTTPETQKIDENLLPIISANINASGSDWHSNTHIEVTHSDTGVYRINSSVLPSNDKTMIVQLTPAQNTSSYMSWYVYTGTLFCCAYDSSGAPKDIAFSLTVWKNKDE